MAAAIVGVHKMKACLLILLLPEIENGCLFISYNFCHLFFSFLFDFLSTICSTATLDIILSFNAWRSLKWSQILRYLLKFFVAAFWVVLLPISYSRSFQNPTGILKFFSTLGGNWRDQSFYSYCIAIYLIPNILAVLMFLLPPLRRSMERSNWRIITLLMWWAQASTYSCC